MEFAYTVTGDGVRIDKILEPQAVAVLPKELEGCPVTELGSYAFSKSEVEEVHLPPGLKKIGAYGFYGCGKLKRIYCYGRILDLGAGVFAGVGNVEFLDITEFEGEKSCFKDMLSELRQTLRVRLHRRQAQESGGASVPGEARQETEARLIFPEYFEESVENTPARILFIETHGCGHRYRYCFAGREFQYRGYDELFPHVKVQEPEALVTEMALGRLLFPCGLTQAHEQMYREYVGEHWRMAGQLFIEADKKRQSNAGNLDAGGLPWLVQTVLADGGQLLEAQTEELVSMAQQAGDTEMVSWLMDFRRDRKPERKRRFEL